MAEFCKGYESWCPARKEVRGLQLPPEQEYRLLNVMHVSLTFGECPDFDRDNPPDKCLNTSNQDGEVTETAVTIGKHMLDVVNGLNTAWDGIRREQKAKEAARVVTDSANTA